MSTYRHTEHEGRTGIWAQGEGVFFPDVPPEVSVHALYRAGLRLAEIAVETGPGIDGLAARALRKEVIALRAALAPLVADPWAGWHWDEELCAHYCVLCGESGPGVAAAPRHGATCPYVAARAALAGADGRQGGDREDGD